MKVSFLIGLSLLIISIPTNAQEGWFWQNPLPQGNDLIDIFVISATIAVANGRVGTIIKTSDEGTTWEFQTSGTNYNINSVYFTDSNVGWIVGDGVTILKTTDGGAHWNTEISGTIKILESVYFIDDNIGWAVCRNGTVLRTTNGGMNWEYQESGVNGYLYSISFGDSYTGWIAGNNGILKTTNSGISWINQG